MTTQLERILAMLPDARKSGTGWSACCPAHEDRQPSLSIAEGEDGRVLLKCHAGCSLEAICEAMGLKPTDLFAVSTSTVLPAGLGKQEYRGHANGQEGNGQPQIVATYDYRDEHGELLFQVVRYEPKDFRQRRPKPGGGWVWSVKGVRVIPYRLPELLAEPTRPVFVVEGEKDVDSLARIGVLATCNAGGAGKWTAEHAVFLPERQVFAAGDNDDSGRKHLEQVVCSLHGIAESVRIVELPDLPNKGDVSDWLAAGGSKDELKQLAEAAPVWTPGTAQPWPEIISLDTVSLPEFPTHALPGVLRDWVEAESYATQTPADLAALLALAVCSSTIARRVVIEPRSRWEEPVNLYVAVLLEPGNRKSAVFSDATRPLGELEAELIEAARPSVARAQSDRRQSETRLKRLEKLAAEKGDADARHEAGNLAEELTMQVEPVLPRLIVDDATSEKLGMMLAEQGGRIASMSPEGGVFDLMAGLYSKNGLPQFGVYLMGHSGDNLKSDRVSRSSVYVERPALTCAYAMQPQVIVGLAANAAFRGRGLLARFLYAAPQSWIGQREIAPAPVPDAVRIAYHGLVKAMADVEGEFTLHLSTDAASMLEEWEAEIEAMLADGGQMEIMRDWGAKLAGATLRLGTVIHCADHGPTGYIDQTTLAAAIEISRYLVPHAEAVLNMMQAKETSGDEDARYVLRWIERHGRREFTKSEAQHQGKRRFPKADDIDPALADLTRRGYIRLVPAEPAGPGRPPSPKYEVNPAVFISKKHENRSHNSRNSIPGSDGGNSGNNGSALEQSETASRVQVTI
jgi:putative DNA primase/helicase